MQPNLSKILSMFGLSNQKPSGENIPAEFDPKTLGLKEIYLEWESLVKAEVKQMNKRFSRTFIIIAVVIALLLIVMQEYGLIFVVASLVFFLISLNRLPDHSVHIEVSNHGVKYGEDMYYWHSLSQFFFKQVAGGEIMIIDTYNYLPGRLFFNFDPAQKESIKNAVSKHINFVAEEPRTFLDKLFDNVKSRFNI